VRKLLNGRLDLLNRISGRLTVVLVTIGLCVATIAAVIVAAFWNVRYALPTHDKTVVINTTATIGALVLVAWGVIVALAAYVSATGSPDLSPTLIFRFSFPNEPTFLYRETRGGNEKIIEPFRQCEGSLRISNASKYSARNPGVRITLNGLGGIPEQPGWRVVASENMVGIITLEWDGGADYIIHGRWSRTLPRLDVKGMFALSDDPAFIIDIAADGFEPKHTRISVKVLNEAEYDQYSSDRLERLKREGVIREAPSGEAG
jgi:hypothetical protein